MDYLIYFVKSNGVTKPKVYKLKTIELESGQKLSIHKSHSLKPITTMVYYSGVHQVTIQVNGQLYSHKNWFLAGA